MLQLIKTIAAAVVRRIKLIIRGVRVLIERALARRYWYRKFRAAGMSREQAATVLNYVMKRPDPRMPVRVGTTIIE